MYFIDVAIRHGTVMLLEMMIFMQFLTDTWKSESEVTPALREPVFLQGFTAAA